MDREKINQAIRIAEKYYVLGMGQEQIAESEKISTSTVSRILRKAIEEGFIKISINYPIQSVTELEEKLETKFNLKKAFVIQSTINSFESTVRNTCTALANDLVKLVKSDNIIGISWGRTMNMLSKVLVEMTVNNVKVVQLNGSVSKQSITTSADKIVSRLSEVTHGTGYMIPVPAVVDTAEIASVLMQESSIKSIIDLGRKSDLIIYSIGAISKESILYEANYINDKEMEDLIAKDAVGDICSRYIDIDGNIACKDINDRVVGINLEELRQLKNKIAIAVGGEKAKAIIGALNGGFVDRLYIDEITAEKVLEIYDENI